MNLLDAIGQFMDRNGLKEILEALFSENAVVHMLTGKAVHRAFRGHLLLGQCLTDQIVSTIIVNEPGFERLVKALEQLYCQVENSEIDVDRVQETDSMGKSVHAVALKKDLNYPELSKTWLNYQHVLRVARRPTEADRTGYWQMHLHAVSDCLPIFPAAGHPNYMKPAYMYLHNMTALEIENHEVFQTFMCYPAK